MDFDVPLTWTPEVTELFLEFMKLRKAKRKPLATERGVKARIAKLERLSGNNMELKRKIIEQTLDEEWLDFYELKEDQKVSKWDRIL